MKEKIDSELVNNDESIIKDLIKNITSIKRQINKENNNEMPEVKLGRRLEQRSSLKLSEEILDHLITRYQLDNNKLPNKEELINMMINFLGNIQKTPDNYNLKNNKKEITFKKTRENRIGTGFHGKVYFYNLRTSQTKKQSKTLAYKDQNGRPPYTIDIHITSAVLLALYEFQPKYYNLYFMEIANYPGKSKERTFNRVPPTDENLIKKNIKWYILHNFTNISDQFRNSMIREINNEFIKIDIRRLNSERKKKNIVKCLNFMDIYMKIFINYKSEVIKELDKILILKEQFLLDLIIFRTERGCFNITSNELAIQIDCISSSYKVVKISDDIPLEKFLKKKTKHYYNSHLEINPALSWMLFMLFKNSILNETLYNDYISKFNNKSKKYEEIKNFISNEGLLIFKKSLYIYDIKKSENIEEEKNIENKEKEKEEIKTENGKYVKEKSKNELKEDITNGKIEKKEEEVIITNQKEEEKRKEIEINEVKNDENLKEETKEEKISEKIDEEIKEEIEEEEIKEEIEGEEIKEEVKENMKEVNKNKEYNISLKYSKIINNIREEHPNFFKYNNKSRPNILIKDFNKNNNRYNTELFNKSINEEKGKRNEKSKRKIKNHKKLDLSYSWKNYLNTVLK